MKKALLALALTLCAFGVAADEPALADGTLLMEEPVMSPADTAEAPALGEVGRDEPLFLGKTICQHPNPGINCAQWNSSYCTYAWDCQCCCAPTYTAPGASCPSYCI